MQSRDKEIFTSDRDDIFRLIAKGYLSAADVIAAYCLYHENERAEALSDALKWHMALKDIESLAVKYHGDMENAASRQRFGLFNRAYATAVCHQEFTPDIDFAGSDLGEAAGKYLHPKSPI